MGERELVTRAQADVFFGVLLVLGLAAGPLAAWIARRRGGSAPVLVGLATGLPFVLIGVLWRVYNAITDRLGLDSIVNLAVNLALFLAVGVICGLVWRSVAHRVTSPPSSEEEPREVGEAGP